MIFCLVWLNERCVSLLHKSWYRIKQTSCHWIAKFFTTLRVSFSQSWVDCSLSTKIHGNSSTFIHVYVVDIIMSDNDYCYWVLWEISFTYVFHHRSLMPKVFPSHWSSSVSPRHFPLTEKIPIGHYIGCWVTWSWTICISYGEILGLKS